MSTPLGVLAMSKQDQAGRVRVAAAENKAAAAKVHLDSLSRVRSSEVCQTLSLAFIWATDFIWVVLSSLRFDIGFVIWAFSSKNDNTLTKKR